MWEAPLNVALEGPSVRLEPLASAHTEELRVSGSDPIIWRWMPTGTAPAEGSGMDDWVAAALLEAEAGERVPFAVIDRASGEVIGSTSYLELRPKHRGLEIGWTWYARERWGTGVNAACKLLLLEHAFERAGAIRVEFKTDRRNERSRAALAKIGAQFEGVLRNHRILTDGGYRDSAYYSVIDEEWLALRAGLEEQLRRH